MRRTTQFKSANDSSYSDGREQRTAATHAHSSAAHDTQNESTRGGAESRSQDRWRREVVVLRRCDAMWGCRREKGVVRVRIWCLVRSLLSCAVVVAHTGEGGKSGGRGQGPQLSGLTSATAPANSDLSLSQQGPLRPTGQGSQGREDGDRWTPPLCSACVPSHGLRQPLPCPSLAPSSPPEWRRHKGVSASQRPATLSSARLISERPLGCGGKEAAGLLSMLWRSVPSPFANSPVLRLLSWTGALSSALSTAAGLTLCAPPLCGPLRRNSVTRRRLRPSTALQCTERVSA